jgi:hypothetical protein
MGTPFIGFAGIGLWVHFTTDSGENVARVSLSAPLWAVPGLVKPPGVVEDVGQDARDEASREEVGEAQEEARRPGVEGVGEGLPGAGWRRAKRRAWRGRAQAPSFRKKRFCKKPRKKTSSATPERRARRRRAGGPSPAAFRLRPSSRWSLSASWKEAGKRRAKRPSRPPRKRRRTIPARVSAKGCLPRKGKPRRSIPEAPRRRRPPWSRRRKRQGLSTAQKPRSGWVGRVLARGREGVMAPS